MRPDNDGSKLPVPYILNIRAVYGSCRQSPCGRWKWNLGVCTLRPLLGAPHTLLPVTGVLWLPQVYLSSFWQYVQNDCTENTLDLKCVEVTEVDWILESGVVSSGPVVERTRLSAGRMVVLGVLVPLLALLQGPSVYTEN